MLTAAEQEIVHEAKALVGDLFPDARYVERLELLGGVDLPARVVYFDQRNPVALKVDIGFKIQRPNEAGGDLYVTSWFFALERAEDEWDVTEYSMHFGPEPYGRFWFRVCDNPQQEPRHHFHHHVHSRKFPGGHIPALRAKPALPRRADPSWFVDVLEGFINSNTVSIGVTK